jgi:tetratricopeptide (TPR) repeat protein
MFRKGYFSFLLLTCTALLGGLSAVGQTATTNGTVLMEGTKAPVVGAVVEAYRTDLKQTPLATKTNKKGEFAFAALFLGPEYAIAVSGPGINPTVYSGVKAGQERLVITVSAGDGHKLTADEVRKQAEGSAPAKGGGSTEMSAEEKKQRAEIEAKNAEITAKNEKIKKATEVVTASFKAGNDALAAKNYDLAVAKYDEGIAADPDFVGSAPQLNINRAAALTSRAVEIRNKAITATDATQKVEGLSQARKGLLDAANGYMRAWNVLINAPGADITNRTQYDSTKLLTLTGAKDTFRTAARIEQVDPALIEIAKVLLPEYLKAEQDAAKKAEASLVIGDLYRVAGDSDNAIAAYRAILETNPDNLDALAGAGLSLVNSGYIKIENGKGSNNKALQDEGKKDLQEGANLLGKFASAAPDTHKLKADAVALVEMLKKEQNVAPQKVATPGRKKQ